MPRGVACRTWGRELRGGGRHGRGRARLLLGSDCALSTTGVAGPGGGTDEKPVGLVFIGSVVSGVTEVERLRLFGRRDQIRERAALAALDLLRRRLLRGPAGA